MRVLIVSPDPAERQRAASALHLRDDVDVVEVAGGAEAGTLLRDREHPFDVLVIDGDLQPKGGFSWLYELRAEAQLRDDQRPPAVVMTARAQDKFLADWSGAERMVRKPVDGFELVRVVAELAGHAPTAA